MPWPTAGAVSLWCNPLQGRSQYTRKYCDLRGWGEPFESDARHERPRDVIQGFVQVVCVGRTGAWENRCIDLNQC